MKKSHCFFVFLYLLAIGCQPASEISQYAQHYQKHRDYASLSKVVELMPLDSDTTYVKSVLGEGIDMGFDYRYLTDSTGVKGCVIGAVFHINSEGKIDQKWIDEICE